MIVDKKKYRHRFCKTTSSHINEKRRFSQICPAPPYRALDIKSYVFDIGHISACLRSRDDTRSDRKGSWLSRRFSCEYPLLQLSHSGVPPGGIRRDAIAGCVVFPLEKTSLCVLPKAQPISEKALGLGFIFGERLRIDGLD